MKAMVKTISLFIFLLIFTSSNCLANNGPYDFLPGIFEGKIIGFKNLPELDSIYSDYFNFIISEKDLLKRLIEAKCEPEIISFTRKRPDISLYLIHMRILIKLGENTKGVLLLYTMKIIKDPKAQYARNRGEYILEDMYYKNNLVPYYLYYYFKEPENLKRETETTFHNVRKNHFEKR